MFVEKEEIIVYCRIITLLPSIVPMQSAVHFLQETKNGQVLQYPKTPAGNTIKLRCFSIISNNSCILMARLPNILVTGTPGTGKTTFADMIAVVVVAGI